MHFSKRQPRPRPAGRRHQIRLRARVQVDDQIVALPAQLATETAESGPAANPRRACRTSEIRRTQRVPRQRVRHAAADHEINRNAGKRRATPARTGVASRMSPIPPNRINSARRKVMMFRSIIPDVLPGRNPRRGASVMRASSSPRRRDDLRRLQGRHRAVRRLQNPVAGPVVAPLARVGRPEQGDGRHAQRDGGVHDRRVVADKQAQAARPAPATRADRTRPRRRPTRARVSGAQQASISSAASRSSGPPITRSAHAGRRQPAHRRPAAKPAAPQRLRGRLAPGWMPIRRRRGTRPRPRPPAAARAGLPLPRADPEFQRGVDRRVGRDGAQDIEIAGDLAFFPVVIHAAVQQRPAPLRLEAGPDARRRPARASGPSGTSG